MKRFGILVPVIAGLLFAVNAVSTAAGPSGKVTRKKTTDTQNRSSFHSCASCHSLSKEEAGVIFKGIGEVTDVKISPVKGLYEVTVINDQRRVVAYLDFGKKYLATGPIFDIAGRRPITPAPVEVPKFISQADLDRIPLSNSIIMGKKDGKQRIIVFTDPDCPFCGRLHSELKKLVEMEPDLAIYIKLYPLKMHPNAFDKARVILGSNSLDLLEKAFAGQPLPPPTEKDLKEPVDETVKLGESLGINGTPAIIMPDGRLLSGAKEAAALRVLLHEKARKETQGGK